MPNTSIKIFLILPLAFLYGILPHPLPLFAQQTISHSYLLEYYGENGEPEPVSSPADWYKRREQILEGMQLAMLALHPAGPLGKLIVAGKGPHENRQYGLELAQRGYVVLCPDYPSFGDYEYDFENDGYISGTLKGIFNHMRCVDQLESLAYVDPERIGLIDHSLGGHNAMFIGVFDQRLKVIVSSCGWTPFHHYYEGNIKGWTSPRYMPRLRDVYNLDPDLVPFDFYEVVGALAPRPFFSNSPLNDSNFNVEGVKLGINKAAKIYRLLDKEEALNIIEQNQIN